MKFLRTVATVFCGTAVSVTLLSLVRHPHWIFRSWDFPRLQIASLALIGAATRMAVSRGKKRDHLIAGAALLAAGWQARKIAPYTPLVRPQSKRAADPDPEATFSLLISNVLGTNRQYGRFLQLVREYDPDLILAVETDDAWVKAISALDEAYPHRVLRPLDNLYGMVLLSKLELVNPVVRFLVEDDIPSVHTGFRLPNDVVVQLHGIHPRPPEPIHDQSSTPRDAELILVAKKIQTEPHLPTVVSGDLNDVAWSETSQRFVRLSRLLDPRVGRGFYNSFNAKNPLVRFPLDHVFHSTHFKLIELRRLQRIGSDHFPIFIRLVFDPAAPAEQSGPAKENGDEEQAAQRLDQQKHEAATGAARPNDA